MSLEFEPWPKIARLNRDCIITEKLDGTNAAVVVTVLDRANYERVIYENFDHVTGDPTPSTNAIAAGWSDEEEMGWVIYAQSRSRFITPQRDNYGFASWVKRNASGLAAILGEGRHFGEWWGAGIQRKYGLTGNDKRFSLFNARRWRDNPELLLVPGLSVVPTLYEGPFSTDAVEAAVDTLRTGSLAADFDKPEGIVVWHDAAKVSFKVTLADDEAPKGAEAHALDEVIA